MDSATQLTKHEATIELNIDIERKPAAVRLQATGQSKWVYNETNPMVEFLYKIKI